MKKKQTFRPLYAKITEEQYMTLKLLAAQKRSTIRALIREMLDMFLYEKKSNHNK